MACWSSGSAARSPRTCRSSPATAASSRRLFGRARRVAPAARREPPHGRGIAGALRRRDRGRLAQDPPQQRDRLLHRGIGATMPASSGRSSSTARPWPAPALHHGRAGRARNQDRQRRRQGAGAGAAALRRSRRRGHGAAAPRSPRRRRRWPRSIVAAALAELAAEGGCCRPPVDDGTAFEISGGRHPVVEAALPRRARAAVSSPMTAPWPRQRIWLAHRPQHGRQEHLPAPERADRDPGADRLLRAGAARRGSASSIACSAGSAPPTIWRAAARPSWSRWSRPRRS